MRLDHSFLLELVQEHPSSPLRLIWVSVCISLHCRIRLDQCSKIHDFSLNESSISTLPFVGPLVFLSQVNISSSLNTNSSRFCRNGTCSTPTHYYRAFSLTVSVAGTYLIASQSTRDMYGFFYDTTFNPLNPRSNALMEDDDSAGDGQFCVVRNGLQTGRTYTVVATTFDPNTIGAFTLIVYGVESASISIVPLWYGRRVTLTMIDVVIFACFSLLAVIQCTHLYASIAIWMVKHRKNFLSIIFSSLCICWLTFEFSLDSRGQMLME